MATVSLPDIRLPDCDFTTLPRLKRLRAANLAAEAEVCIERSLYVTGYLRDLADPAEPMPIRYAKAVAHFLAHKAPLFPDDNLLAGTTTSKPFGAPVYPELTGMSIWPELDTLGTRAKNPQRLAKADAELLNRDIFPYWMERTVLEHARAQSGEPACFDLFQRFAYFLAGKAGTISHTVPHYKRALEEGLDAIVADAAAREASAADPERRMFYRSVQIALGGAIAYAGRLAAEARRRAAADAQRCSEWLALAEVCEQVPAKPARNFREAVNSLWLLQVAIHAENINMAMSPGRLDQLLHPWYQADLAAGRITPRDAVEIVGCLWLKLNDNTNLVPETAEELFGGAGTVPAVTIGGVDADGEDAVNDLTYVMLRVTELLKTRDPSMNARYHYEENSPAYRDRVAEVIVATKAVPAFHNDVADIRTLENQGTATADARDYAIIGCVELASAGRSYDASSAIILNLVSALELALYDGRRPITGDERIGPATGNPAGFASFVQFRAAFRTQLEFLIGEAVALNEILGKSHQALLPTPLLSGLFEGPLEKGADLIRGGARYNSSGATHVGFADTVDSLNAIRRAVFEDRKCSFAELVRALRADFVGYEALHAYLVNKTPKYGNDDPEALENAQWLVRLLYNLYQSHTNYRGGKYRPAYWTMTNHAGQGKLCGALPNGRHAQRILASGITPVSQATANLAAAMNSVASLDGLCIPGGQAFNLKFPAVESAADRSRFGAAVEAYFRKGGLQCQFNVMTYEMLLEAKAHPENYPDLLVRVSGYSAYFKDLNDAMKDEIITRSAYDIGSGQAVPFPAPQRPMIPTAGRNGDE